MANNMFAGGLRADYVRKQLETKNTLTSKGALYVGLGTKTYSPDLSQAVDTVGNKNIYQTTALPAGANNYVLMADSTATVGLKYGLIGDANISDSSISGTKLKNIDASKITSGTLDSKLISTIDASKIVNGPLNSELIPTIDASKIVGGTLNSEIIPTIENSKLRNSSFTIGLTSVSLGSTVSEIKFGSGSSTGVIINSSGVQSTIYRTLSDKRLKTNIQPYQYNNSILDLPIYSYDYINGGGKSIGFIAQDLQEKYPELVSKDENGYLSISETKLVYLLIEEIKKLKQEINNRG